MPLLKYKITTNRSGLQGFIECNAVNDNVAKIYHGDNWWTTHSAHWKRHWANLPNPLGGYVAITTGHQINHGDQISLGWDEMGGGSANVTLEAEIDGVIVHSRSYTNVNSCFTTFRFSVGDQDGTPTYLETLDKLDQWSSAQYIPNSRNELNL